MIGFWKILVKNAHKNIIEWLNFCRVGEWIHLFMWKVEGCFMKKGDLNILFIVEYSWNDIINK